MAQVGFFENASNRDFSATNRRAAETRGAGGSGSTDYYPDTSQ